jgi:rod shape-determining protein MreD
MNDSARIGFWVFVAVLVVLHFVLRVGLGFDELAPDFLVVALLLAAREMRAGFAAGLGLLFGVLDGAIVPITLGASALALAILGFLGARSRDLFSGDSLAALAIYLFAGKWIFDLLFFLITGNAFRPGASYLVLISPLAALYATAVGLVGLAIYRVFA